MKKKKILYVEDSKDTAKAMKIILESSGYNVDLAFKGKEGLEKIKNNDYDLVLLDIMLPDITGIDIFKKAVKLKKKSKCKFVFLSIIALSIAEITKYKKEGLTAHINKPIRREQIINTVKGILEMR